MGRVRVKIKLREEPIEVDETEVPVLRSQDLLEGEPEPVTKTPSVPAAATAAAGTTAPKAAN